MFWAHYVFLNVPDTLLSPSHHFPPLPAEGLTFFPVVAVMLSVAVLAMGGWSWHPPDLSSHSVFSPGVGA